MECELNDKILFLLKDKSTKDSGFSLLMNSYKMKIYNYIRRMVINHEDAQDILQETFIKVYLHINTFNNNSQILTWIYRIASNLCIEYFRKQSMHKKAKANILAMIAENIICVGDETEKALTEKFHTAVFKLPEKQKIVFNLRYYDELTYEEMSKVLQCSVNTLKTNYHYACEKIKNHILNS
jgi:RNA polymerase sigma-70 factor (ECF subfamily)